MKVYWVRHGRTEQNDKNTYYGRLDTRLTPEGVAEVKALKTSFDGCLNVYTSSAARAIETASLLFTGVYFKVDSRILERNMGIFEGLHHKEIEVKYPEEQSKWYKDWKDYVMPDGESARMQYERVKQFIKELENQGEDAIVVAHAGTIRMALVYILGEDLEMFWKFSVDTATVVTTVFEDGYWYVGLSKEYS